MGAISKLKKKRRKKRKTNFTYQRETKQQQRNKKLQEQQNQSSASSIKRINALANSATLKDLNNHWRSLSLVIFSGYWVMAELFPWQETPHSKSKNPKKLTVEKKNKSQMEIRRVQNNMQTSGYTEEYLRTRRPD